MWLRKATEKKKKNTRSGGKKNRQQKQKFTVAAKELENKFAEIKETAT